MGVLRRALPRAACRSGMTSGDSAFPGLAESQMGVYYPPHASFTRSSSLEAAYTASLVGHVVLGGLGAFVLARRFGASVGGRVLGGVAWGMSGSP